MGNMRVLVLHQHYWPEIAATAQILTDLCEELARAGHDVTVVTAQPSYRAAEGLLSACAKREERSGVRIRRVWSYVPPRRSISRRLIHYVTFFFASLIAALREPRPDVVLVMSTPPLLLGVSGALLRVLKRVPFVYSVQDLYPDVAIALGILKAGRLTDAVDAVARKLYRAAAHVVALSPAMAEKIVAKGVAPARVRVIPNWADTDAVRPYPRENAFAREHGLTGRFVVQYSGNVGLTQGLEQLLDVAVQLADEPVLFAIIGDGNARPALEEAARRRKLPNVKFIPPQPRERLPEVLASCDVGLVTMKRGVANDLVPSKLYGIMAAGRPVLASVELDSEVARVLRAHRCGVLVDAENPAALASSIREMLNNPDELGEMGEAGRASCSSFYSRTACAAQYESVLREVVSDRAALESSR
jgi:colanic acid biosynthesis glycosyl transferase WcaI